VSAVPPILSPSQSTRRRDHRSGCVILCDLDDTLIETSPLYTRAVDALVAHLHRVLPEGVPAEAIREAQERVDGHLTGSAFDPERFPRSFSATYRHFCEECGVAADPAEERRCLELGRYVYEEIPSLSPHAREFLTGLAPRAELWLYTLGVDAIQRPKISAHGLEPHFDAVHIVPDKSVATLAALVDGRERASCAIVGDSLRFEINPALELGLFAVHIQREVTWKFAQSPPVSGAYHGAADLREARAILEQDFFTDSAGAPTPHARGAAALGS
jgi:putative hydrolase of the HAD superfamily